MLLHNWKKVLVVFWKVTVNNSIFMLGILSYAVSFQWYSLTVFKLILSLQTCWAQRVTADLAADSIHLILFIQEEQNPALKICPWLGWSWQFASLYEETSCLRKGCFCVLWRRMIWWERMNAVNSWKLLRQTKTGQNGIVGVPNFSLFMLHSLLQIGSCFHEHSFLPLTVG